MLNSPQSPLLNTLERLGALSEEVGGLIKIKPFKDWKGSSWQHRILSMRLLNAGEMLEVYDYCEKYEGEAKTQAYMIEIVLRSLYMVDGQMLASDEEVLKYNQSCKTSLSRVEYLRLWAVNLEQVVIARLHSIYEQLQLKQIRIVNGQYQCEVSGRIFDKIPENSKILKYGIGEIISGEELKKPDLDLSIYNFEDEVEPSFTKPIETPVVEDKPKEFNYICQCGEGFDLLEEFTSHRENCKEAGTV